MAKTSDKMDKITRKKSDARMRVRTCKGKLYDMPRMPLKLKVRVVKTEPVEVLVYGGVSWTPVETTTPNSGTYIPYPAVHHRSKATKKTDHALSRPHGLQRTRCEIIEATVRTRRLLWAGTVVRIPNDRQPERAMTHELDGTVMVG